jgi:hypothetical protein
MSWEARASERRRSGNNARVTGGHAWSRGASLTVAPNTICPWCCSLSRTRLARRPLPRCSGVRQVRGAWTVAEGFPPYASCQPRHRATVPRVKWDLASWTHAILPVLRNLRAYAFPPHRSLRPEPLRSPCYPHGIFILCDRRGTRRVPP